MKCWIRRAIASTRLKVCVLDRVFLFQRLVMGADGSRGELRAAQCGVCPVIFPVPLRSVPLHAPLLVMFGPENAKGPGGMQAGNGCVRGCGSHWPLDPQERA